MTVGWASISIMGLFFMILGAMDGPSHLPSESKTICEFLPEKRWFVCYSNGIVKKYVFCLERKENKWRNASTKFVINK